MKINYKNISGSPIYEKCPNCIFTEIECHILCEHFNFCTFIKTKGDIFDENLL